MKGIICTRQRAHKTRSDSATYDHRPVTVATSFCIGVSTVNPILTGYMRSYLVWAAEHTRNSRRTSLKSSSSSGTFLFASVPLMANMCRSRLQTLQEAHFPNTNRRTLSSCSPLSTLATSSTTRYMSTRLLSWNGLWSCARVGPCSRSFWFRSDVSLRDRLWWGISSEDKSDAPISWLVRNIITQKYSCIPIVGLDSFNKFHFSSHS